MARFISFVHLFLLIKLVNADIFSKLFEKKIGFNDNGSATMSSAHSSSAVHCVTQVLNQMDCIAVVYHNDSQMCNFLDSVETDTGDVGNAYIFIGGFKSRNLFVISRILLYPESLYGVCCRPPNSAALNARRRMNAITFRKGSKQVTRAEEKDFCINEGATLVEIETSSENHFIQETLSTIENPNHWIGMTDSEQEGVWVWASGMIESYLNWGRDQPYNGRGAQCGAIMESFEYEWVDEPCSVLFYPLCEKVSASRPY